MKEITREFLSKAFDGLLLVAVATAIALLILLPLMFTEKEISALLNF